MTAQGRERTPGEWRGVVAVTGSVLAGLIAGLEREYPDGAGWLGGLRLRTLAGLARPGRDDLGLCFARAVDDAVAHGNPLVMETGGFVRAFFEGWVGVGLFLAGGGLPVGAGFGGWAPRRRVARMLQEFCDLPAVSVADACRLAAYGRGVSR